MSPNFTRITLVLYCIFALFHSNVIERVRGISKHPIVILVAFDGFRFDYVSRGRTPTLDRLRREGVRTDHLQNVFPTKTFPNFFSIATGLHPETHGVLGNKVFNARGECLPYGHELFHYDENVLPIWTLNELTGDGRYSGSMLWISGQYRYRDMLPTYYEAYNHTIYVQPIPWRERVSTTMKWILHEEKPANLLHVYFEQPDSASHQFGMNSQQANEQLSLIDDILRYFLEQLRANNLEGKVNLLILSDHGMIDVDLKNIIDLGNIVRPECYELCGTSPVLQIIPKSGFGEEIYQNLTSAHSKVKMFRTYRKDEIPDRWRYKNCDRTAAILLVADPPYGFYDDVKGDHGYDNRETTMRAFFAAVGPLFRRNYFVESLLNVDIFALLVYVLQLDTSLIYTKPNSTLSNIVKILNEEPAFRNNNTRKVIEYFAP